jgi:hypothetical protein
MYIILDPHSNTNPSGDYRVVYNADWMAYINGKAHSYPISAACRDYAEAERTRNELNSVNLAPGVPEPGTQEADAYMAEQGYVPDSDGQYKKKES